MNIIVNAVKLLLCYIDSCDFNISHEMVNVVLVIRGYHHK